MGRLQAGGAGPGGGGAEGLLWAGGSWITSLMTVKVSRPLAFICVLLAFMQLSGKSTWGFYSPALHVTWNCNIVVLLPRTATFGEQFSDLAIILRETSSNYTPSKHIP